MKRTGTRLAVAAATVLAGAAGCGSQVRAFPRPFVATEGVESGPQSGLWGDGSSGPQGMHVGCIRGRRLALALTVRNRSGRAIWLLGGEGQQELAAAIRRVAVQVRVAPPPPKGDLEISGLEVWNPHDSPAVLVPAGRDAWVQENFLMLNCSELPPLAPAIVNRSLTLTYQDGSRHRTQTVTVRSARIFLTRGPLHPSLPINQAG